jgi:cephalosporin hydroxylase
LPATAACELGADEDRWIDVLLIDTEHTYDQVTGELELWWPRVRVGGYVLAHDTETFPGVRAAIEDWLQVEHGDVHYVLPCNGMAVIRKRA